MTFRLFDTPVSELNSFRPRFCNVVSFDLCVYFVLVSSIVCLKITSDLGTKYSSLVLIRNGIV